MKTHYEVLGVGAGASPQEIRAAYKAQIRRFHPDVYEGPAEEATEKAIELNGAYAVLSDPERRTIYDRMLQPVTPTVSPGNQQNPQQAGAGVGQPRVVPWNTPVRAASGTSGSAGQQGWAAYAEEWANRSEWDEEASSGSNVLYGVALAILPISVLILFGISISIRGEASQEYVSVAVGLGGELGMYLQGMLMFVCLRWLSDRKRETWKTAASIIYMALTCIGILLWGLGQAGILRIGL